MCEMCGVGFVGEAGVNGTERNDAYYAEDDDYCAVDVVHVDGGANEETGEHEVEDEGC